MAHFVLANQPTMETKSWSSRQNKLVSIKSKEAISTSKDVTRILEMFKQNHDKLEEIIHNQLPIISSRSKLGRYMIQF
jgi:hypothetical protein